MNIEPYTDIRTFCSDVCDVCTTNDWYCPSNCETLIKAEKIGLERINRSYIRNDGDLRKVIRFVKRAKVNKEAK